MELQGLKKKDLAHKAGVAASAISNYCAGDRMAGGFELYRLARALNVSMEYLLTGEEPPGVGTAPAGDSWRERAASAEAKLAGLKKDLQGVLKKI